MQSVSEQFEPTFTPVPEAETGRRCPACGALARRTAARFCAICGRALDESYLPADALRASYHLQQQRHAKHIQRRAPEHRAPERSRAAPHDGPRKHVARAPNSNNASTTALAFVTYSLVPYLGILFCPGAVIMGSLGLLNWHRAPIRGGRRAASAALILGLLILCLQILLWWVLYKVPRWASQF